MQIRAQWKGSRNWKLVTGAATAATLGLGALAIAIPGGADAAPPTISLDERVTVSAEATTGGFVPFDLGTFTGLHVPDRVVHDDPRSGGGPFWDTWPFSADSRPGQAAPVLAPPATDNAAEAVSDGPAASDVDETTSADASSEPTDDAVSDDAADGPAVAVGDDDPLSDDSVSGDSDDSISNDSDDAAAIVEDSFDSISNDSLDSPDDSD